MLQKGICRLAAAAWVFGLAAVCVAAPPSVTRVEPPNWWVGHTLNPVRLLITGEGLSGATVKAPEPFSLGDLRASDNGSYLLVNLSIPESCRPGSVPLQVVTGAGSVEVAFELLPPLARTGRFQGFSTDDVIYLALPDRFANGDPGNDRPAGSPGLLDRSKPRHYHGGDLRGVMDRLDYLQNLGITAIWLTPWYDNANRLNHFEKYTRDNKLSTNGVPSTDYHGYGAVDFYAVEERFGDLDLLREFVAVAQARGMKVVQDQVANHTGPMHEWVYNPPTPTWFNGSASRHLANSWQIWTTTRPNPPADALRSTLDGWFIDILPDLNQNDPEVATYLIQNSLWWLGMTGIDAVRQDTLPYAPRSYWAQWTAALKREYGTLTILGEVLDGDPKVVSFFQGGQPRFDGLDSGVDTLFDFPLYYAIRDVFAKGQPITRLTETLAADTNYVDPDVLVTFLGLHDKPRFLHEPGATPDGLKLAFTFIATTRGTPLIYYGDEIAMNGGGDPHNRRDFPGGWAEDPRNAFEASGRTPGEQAVHEHVTSLLNLRRELEPLRRGRLVTLAVGTHTYAYARVTPTSCVLVALNNGPKEQRIDCRVAGLTPRPVEAFTHRLGLMEPVKVEDGVLTLVLPPKSSVLLTPETMIVEARKGDGEAAQSAAPGMITE